jgi:glycosyltransferase involved in cell wall biosynthesis
VRVLYVSQTGMTEPLGRSQVLGYVTGLAAEGIDFEIISMEPEATSPEEISRTSERLRDLGIGWRPLRRATSHKLARKLYEASTGVLGALGLARRRRPDIIHARSYFATAIGDVAAAVTPRAKLLFDCRGMIGDEYVDAGHWTEDRIEYRLVKAYERRAFKRADGVVVLTRALKTWLSRRGILRDDTPAQVIPCCVDVPAFRPTAADRARARAELSIAPDDLAVVYSGTLGSWYLEQEMVAFLAALRRAGAAPLFVVLTRHDASSLESLAERAGIPRQRMRRRAISPDRMPYMLSAGDVGLSFIKPCFSKIGSSPTKVAEYLATGSIAVVNSGIGDQADLAVHHDACVVLRSFEAAEASEAARRAVELARRPWSERIVATSRVARDAYGLREVGVARYRDLYERMTSNRRDRGVST